GGGQASGEAEKLDGLGRSGLHVQEVNAILGGGPVAVRCRLEHESFVPAVYGNAPQAPSAFGLHIIEPPVIGGLCGFEASRAGHLHGAAGRDLSAHRHLADVWSGRAIRPEIDPAAVVRPTGLTLFGGFGGELPKRSATGANQVDVPIAASQNIKDDAVAIGGPTRRADI